MLRGLVLSLFPGIDLLGRAFEAKGWCVVWGPDVIYARDIRGWHVPAGRFDGVIGGPPCQAFSRMRHMVEANGFKPRFGNLIPEFKRVVEEAAPRWWLMENVPEAPDPDLGGESFVASPRWLGDTQSRKRRFWFGPGAIARRIKWATLESPVNDQAAMGDGRAVGIRLGGSGKPKATHSQAKQARRSLEDLAALQGYPDLKLPGWTVDGARKAIGNGVPCVMGEAIAQAINDWIDEAAS